MKKTLSIFVVGVLLLGGIGAIADELDQSQELHEGVIPIGYGTIRDVANNTAAQSFIPQKDILTRVELNMSRMPLASQLCYVAIRDELNGENLVEIGLGPDNFSINLTWTEFDFNDLQVIINDTYYIVVYTNCVPNNLYFWSGIGARDSHYPNGTMYRSEDGGEVWNEYAMSDTCFRTYGKDNDPPSVEFINPMQGYLHFSGIPIVKLPFGFIAESIAFGGFRLQPVQVIVTDDFDNSADIQVTFSYDNISNNGTYNTENGYHEWEWTGYGYGKCVLKATAEDSYGDIGIAEMNVWYICFI